MTSSAAMKEPDESFGGGTLLLGATRMSAFHSKMTSFIKPAPAHHFLSWRCPRHNEAKYPNVQ
jgi:hypothetical protein